MLTNLINNLKINSMTEFNSKIKQNSRILKIFLFSICALLHVLSMLMHRVWCKVLLLMRQENLYLV